MVLIQISGFTNELMVSAGTWVAWLKVVSLSTSTRCTTQPHDEQQRRITRTSLVTYGKRVISDSFGLAGHKPSPWERSQIRDHPLFTAPDLSHGTILRYIKTLILSWETTLFNGIYDF